MALVADIDTEVIPIGLNEALLLRRRNDAENEINSFV